MDPTPSDPHRAQLRRRPCLVRKKRLRDHEVCLIIQLPPEPPPELKIAALEKDTHRSSWDHFCPFTAMPRRAQGGSVE